MIFNAKTLLDLNYANNGVNHKPLNISENHSFFIDALNFIKESDQEVRNIFDDILSEAIIDIQINSDKAKEEYNRRFSFTGIVKKIFELFLHAVEQLWLRFKALISRLLNSDLSIKKYKNALLNYDESLKVYIPYYIFTNLDIDIPSDTLRIIFSDEYDDLYDRLQKIANIKQKEKMIDKLRGIYQEISDQLQNGNYYNKVRAKIMGKIDRSIITEQDFQNQISVFFRNGMKEPFQPSQPIASYEVQNAAKRFFAYDNTMKVLEKQYKNVKNSADKTSKKIMKIKGTDIFNEYVPIDYDIEYALNQVLQLKSGQISKTCNLILMAYSAKLDAMKDAMAQDRKILHAAISQVIIKEKPYE